MRGPQWTLDWKLPNVVGLHLLSQNTWWCTGNTATLWPRRKSSNLVIPDCGKFHSLHFCCIELFSFSEGSLGNDLLPSFPISYLYKDSCCLPDTLKFQAKPKQIKQGTCKMCLGICRVWEQDRLWGKLSSGFKSCYIVKEFKHLKVQEGVTFTF